MYAYDIELYQNLFLAVFNNLEDEFDEQIFLVFKDRDDLSQLQQFINQPGLTLVGFNNRWFDDILLRGVLVGYNLNQLHKCGQHIINGTKSRLLNELRYTQVPFQSYDTKQIMGLDISLKQSGVAMRWPKIQDLPIPFNAKIKSSDVAEIIEYCKNDVGMVVEQFRELQEAIKLRKYVSKTYNVNVLSSFEGQIANRLFEKLYSENSGYTIKMLREMRTFRDVIKPEECIRENVHISKTLEKALGKWPDNIVGFRKEVVLRGRKYVLAKGGLHSVDKPGIFVSDNDNLVMDADVTSFYISITMNNKICPAHLNPDIFLPILDSVYQERLDAKQKKDYLKAQTLKIAILAPVGKFNNKDFWFYDPLAFYSVTVTGQLYLLMLIDSLLENGFDVISANTDGIVTIVPRVRKQEYDELCTKWMKLTKFNLDFAQYDKYVRKDVNCYLSIKPDREVKYKGLFEPHQSLPYHIKMQKGTKIPEITPIALNNYFVKGIKVEETLATATDIFDFVMSERVNKKFDSILRKGTKETKLQKTNRYYASTNGGQLVKVFEGRETSILADTPVTIVNEICDTRIPDDLNFKWYEKQIEKIVELIEPSAVQLGLF